MQMLQVHERWFNVHTKDMGPALGLPLDSWCFLVGCAHAVPQQVSTGASCCLCTCVQLRCAMVCLVSSSQ